MGRAPSNERSCCSEMLVAFSTVIAENYANALRNLGNELLNNTDAEPQLTSFPSCYFTYESYLLNLSSAGFTRCVPAVLSGGNQSVSSMNTSVAGAGRGSLLNSSSFSFSSLKSAFANPSDVWTSFMAKITRNWTTIVASAAIALGMSLVY